MSIFKSIHTAYIVFIVIILVGLYHSRTEQKEIITEVQYKNIDLKDSLDMVISANELWQKRYRSLGERFWIEEDQVRYWRAEVEILRASNGDYDQLKFHHADSLDVYYKYRDRYLIKVSKTVYRIEDDMYLPIKPVFLSEGFKYALFKD